VRRHPRSGSIAFGTEPIRPRGRTVGVLAVASTVPVRQRELAHLSDEALVADAVQEAFLGLWRSAGSFIPERAKASTWILTLVHRRAVDLVRREQRRRAEPIEGVPEPAVGSAEEAAWLRLDRERVQG